MDDHDFLRQEYPESTRKGRKTERGSMMVGPTNEVLLAARTAARLHKKQLDFVRSQAYVDSDVIYEYAQKMNTALNRLVDAVDKEKEYFDKQVVN